MDSYWYAPLGISTRAKHGRLLEFGCDASDGRIRLLFRVAEADQRNCNAIIFLIRTLVHYSEPLSKSLHKGQITGLRAMKARNPNFSADFGVGENFDAASLLRHNL